MLHSLTPLANGLPCALEILLTIGGIGNPRIPSSYRHIVRAQREKTRSDGVLASCVRMNAQAMELCVRIMTYLSHR